MSQRSTPADPARTEARTAGTLSNGLAPGADLQGKPGSGKARSGKEELPRKEAGPIYAGPDTSGRPEGMGVSGSPVHPYRGIAELRSGHPERGDAQLAGSMDPGNGGPFSSVLSTASGIEPGPRGVGTFSAAPTMTPPRDASPTIPLFAQVAMKMTPLADGAHDVEIRLAPEHLGSLKIELHIDSGRMDASVQADNSEARAMLLREEPALREALRNSGITLSSFNVALAGDSWRERKGTPQPDGDAEPSPRRNRKEESTESVTSVQVDDAGRNGMNRTEHWIA